jgi:GMP reductase
MQWEEFAAAHPASLPFVAVSCGTGKHDFTKAKNILDTVNVPFVCLDVANGYTEFFVDHVRRVREEHPRITIIAGETR